MKNSLAKSRKARPNVPRDKASLANFKDLAIFLTGGIDENRQILTSAEVYSIKSDTWTIAPDLNVRRQLHSMCSLGDRVYCFGGLGQYITINNVEYIEAGTLLAGSQNQKWNLVTQRLLANLKPRYLDVFCPIDNERIVILGGRSSGRRHKDAYLLCTVSMTVEPLSTLS